MALEIEQRGVEYIWICGGRYKWFRGAYNVILTVLRTPYSGQLSTSQLIKYIPQLLITFENRIAFQRLKSQHMLICEIIDHANAGNRLITPLSAFCFHPFNLLYANVIHRIQRMDKFYRATRLANVTTQFIPHLHLKEKYWNMIFKSVFDISKLLRWQM